MPGVYRAMSMTKTDIELAVEKSRASKLDLVNQVSKAYYQLMLAQDSYEAVSYTHLALYRAFELVRIEARRYGVTIVGSEIIGLVPMEALIDTASYYLGLENFSMQQVLEARIME